MLPYSTTGAYGGSPYGRKKGLFNSQNGVAAILALVATAALAFSVFTHFRASSAHAQKTAIKNELDSLRSELRSIQSQFSSRGAELEQLQHTYGHTQRRMTELTNQLQRKESDLVSKEQALQQHVKERELNEQHRSAREAELTKMVEDLRAELIRTDSVIDALDTKMAKMEATHVSREKDWHALATKWVTYEHDLHDQYKKCTDEVSKLRNLTMAMNDTAPIPEAEPKLRAETDFAQIGTDVPVHKPHHFEPLPPPAPKPTPALSNTADLPLPESKIRESIVQMTGGQVGLEPGQQSGGDSTHQAPEPTQIHHHDVYHQDFHHEDDVGHHYDHYHGHYDSYDPMDEWWLHDAHGDWNADDHGHGDGVNPHDQHHNEHAIHHNQDQYHHNQHDVHHQPDQYHHNQHDVHHQPDQYHHNQHDVHHQPDQYHHNQHDPHAQQQQQQYHHQQYDPHNQQHQQPELPRRQRHQEVHGQQHDGSWGSDAHQHHPSPSPAMHGMDQHTQQAQHVQHAPNHWQQQHDPHAQQYQYQHTQQYQQQQYDDQNHHQHPRGDLAYKMGW